MTPGSVFLGACSVWLALGPAAAGQRPTPAKKIAELQPRFDREANSVRRAKLLAKLGDAQFLESRRAGKAGDYVTAGLVLEKYRDNVRAAVAALRKEHPRAEKEYSGYRIVEVHVRRGLREMDEALLVAPPEYRPPLQLVRQDLADIEDELLRLLFPRRPGEKAAPPAQPPR